MSLLPSSSITNPGRRSAVAPSVNGSANGSRGSAESRMGSSSSASAARAARPLAARSASATRRLARAASTEPPQTSGWASASPRARSFAGFSETSANGEQSSATWSIASATASGCTFGPSCISFSPDSTTIAAASGSAVEVGSSTVDRDPACSAIVETAGQAISSCAPRRTASCTVATKAAGAPSLAITTTRSRAPTQPGRPWVGQATNGTGQTGSSIARMNRASLPAAITARGRGSPRSWVIGSPASAVSRRTRAPRLGQSAQDRVGLGQPGVILQRRIVEDRHHRLRGRRASSISSTGMPCRTG